MSENVPTPEQFSKFYSDLLGNTVTFREVEEPLIWNCTDAYTGAVYQNQEKDLKGGMICDMQFVVYTGAALTITPANTAQYILDTKVLEDHVFDAYYEVMNITAGLLNEVNPTHLALKDCWDNRKKVSKPAKKFLSKPPSMQTYEVDIQGYGKGRVSLCRG